MEKMKKCENCGKEKPVIEFYAWKPAHCDECRKTFVQKKYSKIASFIKAVHR